VTGRAGRRRLDRRRTALLGGEVAAAKLTDYLKPQVKTVYAPTKLAAMQVRFGLKPDDRGRRRY
jgi:hypothetical protein